MKNQIMFYWKMLLQLLNLSNEINAFKNKIIHVETNG